MVRRRLQVVYHVYRLPMKYEQLHQVDYMLTMGLQRPETTLSHGDSLIRPSQCMVTIGVHSPSCNCTPLTNDKSDSPALQDKASRRAYQPLLVCHCPSPTSLT